MVAIAAFVTAAATSRMRRLATTARRHCRRLPDTASTAVSKIGVTVLNFDLARWGFAFDDGKVMTPTCRDMGFREVPRGDYLARLSDAVRLAGKPGRWLAEAGATSVADWHLAKA